MPFITLMFPLWALLLAACAWYFPEPFAQGRGAILPLLALIMFCMGLTLSAADFLRVVRRPTLIGFGLLLQFAVMPLAALLVADLLELEPALVVGMVLVGTSAGGTASNVVTYLARGDLALSVSLTLASTLAAVVMMPLLTELYIGQRVPVPALDMLGNILAIVLLPLLLGAGINHALGERLGRLRTLLPLIAIAAIVVIIAIVVALNHGRLGEVAPLLVLAVVLHNAIGLACGYALPRLAGHDRATCRTLAIEVGMQNSGLSVALAVKYFSAGAALPGALFSIWHNLSGSLLAALWGRRARLDEKA